VERIKRARKARGLSLAQVAGLTGLHPVAIARAERTGKDAKASTVAAIAKALGVPVCELFEEPGHERQRREPKAKR
jgi:transcriptional regulator with XRE-family HTH domain